MAMRANQENGLYYVKETPTKIACVAETTKSALLKWHHRFGHLNVGDVRRLKGIKVKGIKETLTSEKVICEVCCKCNTSTPTQAVESNRKRHPRTRA